MPRDELANWHEDIEAADEMLALGRAGRARVSGRTFTPSILARPLPGAPGVPPRKPLLDLDDLKEVA
jgi:hypothetical protein